MPLNALQYVQPDLFVAFVIRLKGRFILSFQEDYFLKYFLSPTNTISGQNAKQQKFQMFFKIT